MQYGNKKIKDVRFGSKNVVKAYYGSKLVWEKEKVRMIEFTILYTSINVDEDTVVYEHEESYTAIEGMTWNEWCESEYNTEGFKVIDNQVKMTYDLYLNNGYVYGTDVIQPTQYSYTSYIGDGQ